MRIPSLTVRVRLLALIACLLALFGGSDLVMGYLIGDLHQGHATLREEYRRFEVCQAVQQALIESRHFGSKVNGAILVGDRAAEAEGREEQLRAQGVVKQQLAVLAGFEPEKAKLIADNLNSVEDDSSAAIHLLAQHKEKEATPYMNSLQRRLDLVQSTLDGIASNERAKSKAVLAESDRRIEFATRLSLVMVLTAFALGLPLAVVVGRSIAVPLKSIARALTEMNAGRLDFEMPAVSQDEFGQVAAALVQFREGQETLRRIAFFDSLTGLGNRISLERAIAAELGRRNPGGVAVLLFDLDNFRSVNDQHGYQAGDQYLCEAAMRLRRFIPDDAQLFRYSGDRFVAVLAMDHGRSTDDLRQLTETVLRGMSAPHLLGAHLLNMSASIGVAVSPEDGETAEHLITSAEAAGRAAKRGGRNNARFAGGMFTARMRGMMVLAEDLRRGLEQGEFELYYQPIVDGAAGVVVGAEALVRWLHPQRGLLAPSAFVAIAEDAGLIGALGERCLRMAHAQAGRWLEAGMPLRIAVNMSGRQIQDARVLEPLRSLRAQAPAAADLLELELTETVWFERSDAARRALDEIRKLGYRLGMDDFGTGYSSFANLQWLPVDKLKIDRVFVENMANSPQAAAIISAVLALAGTLDLKVVAEGVETQHQMDMLLKQGCRLFQGFLFAPAMPAAEFEAWVGEYHGRQREQRLKPGRDASAR